MQEMTMKVEVEKMNATDEQIDEMISAVPPMIIEVFFGKEQELGIVVRSKYFRGAHNAIATAIGEALQGYISEGLNRLKSKAD